MRSSMTFWTGYDPPKQRRNPPHSLEDGCISGAHTRSSSLIITLQSIIIAQRSCSHLSPPFRGSSHPPNSSASKPLGFILSKYPENQSALNSV
ncbi:hypothetical protein LINPERHAP1_LOCUS5328 [Linum perenne]